VKREGRSTLPAGYYAIADADAAGEAGVLHLARALFDAGVATLQLRMKSRSRREIRRTLGTLVADSAKVATVLVLNDHPEIAAEFEGVGVHLGQTDADPVSVRRLLGSGRLIGWSTHDLDQVRRAGSLPVDYIGFGPVFSSRGKHLHPDDARAPQAARGVDLLREAVRASRVPVVAIGGIDRTTLPGVLAVGVHAVVAIRPVASAPDPSVEAHFWVQACRR
jgi:thiamine-phosphate pyrophosphorylase